MNLLFDFDGTLHQSELIYVEAFKTVFYKATGRKIESDLVKSYIGYQPKKIWKEQTTMSEKEITFYSNQVAEKMLESKKYSKLYSGVISTIESLYNDGHSLHILSNCKTKYLQTLTKHLEIDHYFTKITASESYSFIPKEDIIINQKVEYNFYIGDGESDFIASKKLNIPFIYCTYGYGNLNISGVSNISEIIPIIKNHPEG